MIVEPGPFGGELRSDGSMTPVFAVRVAIPEAEFRRLGLGGYERHSQLPACFRWCFDKFGPGGTRWAPELRDPTTTFIYFEAIQDAMSFVAHWGATEMAVPPAGMKGRRRVPAATRH
jgi:hypothetical protein